MSAPGTYWSVSSGRRDLRMSLNVNQYAMFSKMKVQGNRIRDTRSWKIFMWYYNSQLGGLCMITDFS